MVETPGFCSRRGTCSIAASGAQVRVPLEKPFICPQCGAPLTPPALRDIRPLTRRPAFLASALGIVAVLVGSVVLAQAGFLHRQALPPAPVEGPVTLALATGRLASPSPETVTATLDSPPSAEVPAIETSTAVRAHVLRPPVEATLPRRAPSARRRGANVLISVSLPLVAGGQPDYPEQYEDGQSGTVTVSCGLRPDGGTQGCKTIRRSGGPIFDVAVHSWLDLRDVRFRPSRIRGHLVNHVSLTVNFIGEPATP